MKENKRCFFESSLGEGESEGKRKGKQQPSGQHALPIFFSRSRKGHVCLRTPRTSIHENISQTEYMDNISRDSKKWYQKRQQKAAQDHGILAPSKSRNLR